MTKGELLNKRIENSKEKAGEATKELEEVESKSTLEENLQEECAIKKDKYDNLINELEKLKENYSDIKELRKNQVSDYKREASEYKFEVYIFNKL